MDLHLKDKIVLITGGTNGLGLRIAKAFAEEEANVCVCSIDPENKLREVENELKGSGVKAAALKANVCAADEAKYVVEETVKRFGGIDILINNVGKRFGDSLFEATEEQWLMTYDSIVFQAIRMIKLAAPEMRKRGVGSIVNIASVSGWLPQLGKPVQFLEIGAHFPRRTACAGTLPRQHPGQHRLSRLHDQPGRRLGEMAPAASGCV